MSAMSNNDTSGGGGAGGSGGKRRPPRSLFERAAHVLVDVSLAACLEEPALRTDALALLSALPPLIANELTSTYVTRFLDTHGRGRDRERVGRGALALLDLLGGPVTAVDLSPLVRLGQQEHSNLLSFNEGLLTVLPRLQQLSHLVLATHGKDFTLPVCSDRVLEEVARQCPRLVSLDVSHNTGVSATGLASLFEGCPLLEELLLFDCMLPTAVLAGVLAGLPRLRLLGHKETGMAVLRLWQMGHAAPLCLRSVNNLGEATLHKSATEPHRLRCRPQLVRALRVLCPALETLVVRTLDEDLRLLAGLSAVSELELRFHAAPKPTSLGGHTLRYLRLHGARLTTLTVYSHRLHASHLSLIAEHCPHLRQLWLRANQLLWEAETTATAPEPRPAPRPALRRQLLTRLENLSLRIGLDERSVCTLPPALLQRLLRGAGALRKLYVAVNSADICDAWLQQVLSSFDASHLRSLFVLLPNVNSVPFALHLSMASVDLARSLCPGLEELGNLLVWSLQQEEVRHLQQQLRASNSVLRLVSKETVWR